MKAIDTVLTVKEAAKILSVCPATVQRSLKRGQLPGAKVGRAWRLSLAAILVHVGRELR